MTDFFLQTSSLVSLLFIGSGLYYAAKKYRLPLSATLVGGGILIAYLSKIPVISFLDDFSLTSEILFYALLPVLLFDSAYNMKFRDLVDNRYSIASLSIISLLISALCISIALYYGSMLIGFPIPYMVCLLFASLISATDTAAALSAFKEIWVRRRLTTIFEWESLFNDGTAIALFLVVLWILQWQNLSQDLSQHTSLFWVFLEQFSVYLWGFAPVFSGSITLIAMILAWWVIWIIVGIIFSKIIERIENESFMEITLTITLAHATFLIAEAINYYIFPVSAIIATVVSALFIGNYGRYKISPKVEAVMEKYWGFFSYVANILIFIGVWMLLIQLEIRWKPLFTLMLISIPIVVLARFISVFPVFWVLNKLKKEAHISLQWQFILSWWALRWVMALMMVLLIPQDMTLASWNYPDMSIRDMLLAITVGIIAFSVFVKTLSLPYFIKATKVNELSLTEKILFLFEKILLLETSIHKIQRTIAGRYIDQEEGKILLSEYQAILWETKKRLELEKKNKDFTSSIQKVFIIHALWHQQKHLKRLYTRWEIDEKTFKHILKRIEYGLRDIKRWNLKILNTQNIIIPKNKIENIAKKIRESIDMQYENTIEKKYYEMRSFHNILARSLEELIILKKNPTLAWYTELDTLIEKYRDFDKQAEEKRRSFFAIHRNKLKKLSWNLTKKALHTTEEEIIEDKKDSFMLSDRLAKELLEEMDIHMKYINRKDSK